MILIFAAILAFLGYYLFFAGSLKNLLRWTPVVGLAALVSQRGSMGDALGLVQAGGNFNGAAGAGAAARWQRGGVVARTGAGVYTITLDKPLANTDGNLLISISTPGAVPLGYTVVETSSTVKTITVTTSAAGNAATDSDFTWFAVQGAHGLA